MLQNQENLKYREYLNVPDPTLLPNGCCESYPLDRDYWNNQLLDRNFLIDYGTVQHLKYPISESICVGDRSVSRTNNCCEPASQATQSQKIWTIEEQGLVDGISCQKDRFQKEAKYWLQNDGVGPCSPNLGNISQGLPLIPIEQSNIGQRLAYPNFDLHNDQMGNCSRYENNPNFDLHNDQMGNCSRYENNPNFDLHSDQMGNCSRYENNPNFDLHNDQMGNCSRYENNPNFDLHSDQMGNCSRYENNPIFSENFLSKSNKVQDQCCPSVISKGAAKLDLSNLMNNPGSVGNRRNVDAESALKGLNYLNNEDCYQNKICTDPLQAKKSDLFGTYFQDNNCIYPNFTPKFWDNLTRAKSGTQLVTSNEYSKNALC